MILGSEQSRSFEQVDQYGADNYQQQCEDAKSPWVPLIARDAVDIDTK